MWRHVRCAHTPPKHHETACALLAAAAECQFAASQLKASTRAKKVTIDAKTSVRDGLGEGQEGARQRQLRHRHAAGAVRGTDAASMDGDPIYVYFAYLSFSYL